jgi:hypothetical protein
LPEIYLYVNRFKIHHNAIPKGDAPKPKLRKAPNLKALMTTASEKGRKNSVLAGSNGHSDASLVNSFASQHDQSMLPNQSADSSASHLLFSQYPSNIHHAAPKDISSVNRVSLNRPSELLGLLASSRTNPNRNSAVTVLPVSHRLSSDQSKCSSANTKSQGLAARQEMDGDKTPKQQSFREIANKAGVGARTSTSTDEPLYSNVSQEVISQEVDDLIAEVASHTVHPSNDLADHGPSGKSAAASKQQLSKKRTHGSTDSRSQKAHDDDLDLHGPSSPALTMPSKKRQRTDAGEMMPTDSVEVHVAATPADLFRVSATDPWEGMTEIPLGEIEIPKHQADLLDHLVWIPQGPGVSGPLCNVPPHLLTEWNDIAQRRKRLAERRERPSEHPPTPTPQDTQSDAGSELLPWSQSDAGSPARNALPRDTVTPPRQTRATSKTPTLSGTRHCVGQTIVNDEVDIANVSHGASSPAREMVTASKEVPMPTEPQYLRPLGSVRENSLVPESLVRNRDDEKMQKQTLLNSSSDQPPVPIQKGFPGDQFMAEPLISYELRGESSDAESDDAEMETSVPCALGGSVPLSSQPALDLTSSGPSLPGFTEIIQVVETPVNNTKHPNPERDVETFVINTKRLSPEREVETSLVNNKCLTPERQSKQSTASQLPSSQRPSSQAVKTSSLSQVPNTYRSEDNQVQNDISPQALNPSLQISGDGSPRLDVLGTQTQSSSVHILSQMPTQSSSDVVLDSSRPAQRQRGSSIFHLDPSDDPSSFHNANSHSLPTSQVNDQSQDSSKGRSSLNGCSQLLDLSPREFTAWVATHAEPLSKGPSSSSLEDTETRQEPHHSPNAELVARRQGFLGKPDQSAEAQTIYEKFRNDYSPYTGDFAHFTELCSRLQAMRQRGVLQRSFLWDDFVIQHLQEYPRHFAERASQELKTLHYEDFFCANFSRPQHKKRSLTAHGIDVVASQFVPTVNTRPASLPVRDTQASQTRILPNDPAQGEGANPSFTGSLVENFSNLHARSFGDVPVPDVHMPTATQLFPPSSTIPSSAPQIKEEVNDSPNILMDSQFSSNHTDQKDEDMVDATQPDAYDIRTAPDAKSIGVKEIDETQESGETKDRNDTPYADDTQEADHTYHETASIELGDDTEYRRISPSPVADPDPALPTALGALNDSEPELEPPRQRSNWFRSLTNIFPTGPVWSDDPNTPFKTWARQDQNLLLEINRRGGTKVQLDEKGVIYRPTYNPTKNPDY